MTIVAYEGMLDGKIHVRLYNHDAVEHDEPKKWAEHCRQMGRKASIHWLPILREENLIMDRMEQFFDEYEEEV